MVSCGRMLEQDEDEVSDSLPLISTLVASQIDANFLCLDSSVESRILGDEDSSVDSGRRGTTAGVWEKARDFVDIGMSFEAASGCV